MNLDQPVDSLFFDELVHSIESEDYVNISKSMSTRDFIFFNFFVETKKTESDYNEPQLLTLQEHFSISDKQVTLHSKDLCVQKSVHAKTFHVDSDEKLKTNMSIIPPEESLNILRGFDICSYEHKVNYFKYYNL